MDTVAGELDDQCIPVLGNLECFICWVRAGEKASIVFPALCVLGQVSNSWFSLE